MPIIQVEAGARQHHSSPSRSIKPKAAKHRELKKAKDGKHTPDWDLKIQREHEAKNPGPPKKRQQKKKIRIVISDDEPDEHLGRMDDDWAQALWDDLIKDNSEHWDIRDALKHGKKRSQ